MFGAPLSAVGVTAFLLQLASTPPCSGQNAVEPGHLAGLGVTFATLAGSRATDVATAPNLSLYVIEGQPPTPFLPGGRFTAVWTGNLSVDLRGDYLFRAELRGGIKLELNGTVVLETEGTGGATPFTKPVRLHKGANALKATFTSPPKGDAFVRLNWAEKEFLVQPLPMTVLSHEDSPELVHAEKQRLGRELFLDLRCARCHTGHASRDAPPELATDAPSFEGIGSRRGAAWMARWILDPAALRPDTHMPRLLIGPKAREDAHAIAAFLGSLKAAGVPASATDPDASLKDRGRKLFETLDCAGCHNAADARELDPAKVSLSHLAEKFPPGYLTAYLKSPAADYAWTRMPDFKLTDDEAKQLSAYLLAAAEKSDARPVSGAAALMERGQKLVQNSGCLNCHGLKLENQFTTKQLADLKAADWGKGCLDAQPNEESKAPRFAISVTGREALMEFGRTDRASLTRHSPAEFAARQTRLLNCRACHGRFDGFPPLEILGGKLKPEWAARFIAGEIPYKPRGEAHPSGAVWLPLRMPAFTARAALLAQGLAAQHGYPPQTPAEPPIDMAAAEIGRKLVVKEGGFSCVSCHAVGAQKATEGFESEGINMAWSSERLLSSYYSRWLRSPTSIDPQSKMPVYFEDGKSPLTEVLDGDADKQINAIWQYLRLGSNMPPPAAATQ